ALSQQPVKDLTDPDALLGLLRSVGLSQNSESALREGWNSCISLQHDKIVRGLVQVEPWDAKWDIQAAFRKEPRGEIEKRLKTEAGKQFLSMAGTLHNDRNSFAAESEKWKRKYADAPEILKDI